ncbi:MAG: hypothetical protein JWM44_969 [Bacilli bacterium]|nr:hypothetical protein [Bacilli bacterium]
MAFERTRRFVIPDPYSKNSLMENIHDRMPVILRPEDENYWLDKDQKPEDLKELLRPFAAERMKAYSVSKAVGNV